MTRKIPIVKITVWALIISAAASFLPVVLLYTKKDAPIITNDTAIEKLKGKKGEQFRFIVLGDNHAGLVFDDGSALKMIWNIHRENRFRKIPVDFVMVAGDATFRRSEWDYKTYDKLKAMIKFPVITAPGNHDMEKDGIEKFKRHIGRSDFSFADRNSYFIVLDNSRGDISPAKFAKLEEELKKSLAYKHRFVIIHKSPMSPLQQSWYRPEISPWSYKFMKLCEKYRVDAVFSGHEHMYKRMVFGGVKYLVSGGGGIIQHIAGRDGGFLHYLVVRVNGDYVDYEVRRYFPPLWEYFTFYMWKDLLYLLKDIFL
jgi:predicted phosphodiesterase